MGGRGSSSATARAVAPAPQPQPPASAMPSGTGSLAALQSMDDASFVAYMQGLGSIDMPQFLADNDLQRVVYDSNVNDLPQVVDAKTFAQLPGKTMYRTVNSVYDRNTDVGMSAAQICDQTMGSAFSRVGDGIYGNGYYFADTRRASIAYGRTRGDTQRTAVMQMKLNSNARVVSYSQLQGMLRNESRAVRSAVRDIGVYALRKGYNVIDVGRSGYYNVLDRSAITFLKGYSAM